MTIGFLSGFLLKGSGRVTIRVAVRVLEYGASVLQNGFGVSPKYQ